MAQSVGDVNAAIEFHRSAFGFELKSTSEGEHGPQHVEMTHRGELVVMFGPEGAFGRASRAPATTGIAASRTFYVYVDDADASFARATAAGAGPARASEDQYWGDRFAAVTDPDGYLRGLARFQGHN